MRGTIREEVEHMETCSKCSGDTEGYKCDMCGTESTTHDAQHACGGDHCMPKCQGCSEAHVKCTCG
jgi:RecJ-like exonuclease